MWGSILIVAVCAYGLMSLVTFCCYGIDKHRARSGAWRIKERTLHLMALLGGWPGAMMGQILFRHKLRKLDFMLVFALIVIAHLGVWIAIAYRSA